MNGNSVSDIQDEEIKVEKKTVNAKMFLDFLVEVICLMLYSVYVYIKAIVDIFVEPERKSLKGEIVLVTGGANGIGKELCRQMVQYERDFKLVIWDIDFMSLDGFIRELKQSGLEHAHGYEIDVSDREAVEKAALKVRREVGQVTILINNAGIAGPLGEAWNLDPDKVEKVFKVNLLSHAWMLRAFLPSMLKNNHGHVIEMCSILAFCSGRWGSSYVATKQGLKGYVESVKEDIRHEHKNSKVVVSLAFPSFADTAMTSGAEMRAQKYPFLLQPLAAEYVAAKVLDGLLKNKEYIYAPPATWLASWAASLVPMDIARKCIDICDVAGKKSIDTIAEELSVA